MAPPTRTVFAESPPQTVSPPPAVQRVRELVVSYRPFRRTLPVEGSVTGPRDSAKLAAAILADADVERVLALHFTVKHRLIGVHVVSVGTPRRLPGPSPRDLQSGVLVQRGQPRHCAQPPQRRSHPQRR